MKVVYATHDELDIPVGKLVVLGTNNQTVYIDVLNGLRERNDLVSIYDDQYESQSIHKSVDFVGDLLAFEGLSTSNTNALIKEITKGMSVEETDTLQKLNKQLLDWMQSKLFMIDLPLTVTNDMDIKNIFKYAKIHLQSSFLTQPYDIIKMLIKLHSETNDNSLIVVNNLASYLNTDQIAEVSFLCNSTGITLLNIEYSQDSHNNYPNSCDYYYIDNDFIDWHN
jgi:CRISPR type II-A-associated protein Csn2